MEINTINAVARSVKCFSNLPRDKVMVSIIATIDMLDVQMSVLLGKRHRTPERNQVKTSLTHSLSVDIKLTLPTIEDGNLN